MAKVLGSVDDRGRPVVRLEIQGDSLLVLIDTGFNGTLMVTRAAARLLGVNPLGDETSIELGNGTTAQVFEAQTTIAWLGENRLVRVLVADDWLTVGDAPVGLLGTAMLTPHLLMVDFAARTVEIETQD